MMWKNTPIILQKSRVIFILHQKNKGSGESMLRKIGVTTVLTASIIFGGVFTASADSVSDQPSNPSYKVHTYYSVNGKWQEASGKELNNVLQKCFPGYQIQWNFNKQDKHEGNDQVEQEKPQQDTDKVQEQPSEQPHEKPEQEPEQEKPVEQPEAEAPTQEVTQQQPESSHQEENSSQLSQYEQQVVDLTNAEREKQGLSQLKVDLELSRVAKEKSNDMARNNYFDHNSPVYGSPFDMMKSYGVSYRTAGENIAKGQRSPEEVVNAWMNSEGHRANILNGEFTHIGVGYVEQGNHWTQQFIGK